ncbi:MAG: hypothetical protein AAFP77_01390 [Bacteroidota bacterium]
MSINYAKTLRFRSHKGKITFTIDKDKYPLKFYAILDMWRHMHMQDILRLPNANGKQYYMGTFSQNVSGGTTGENTIVKKDDDQEVTNTGGMVFIAECDEGTTQGSVIWVDVLHNGHQAGGINHPGDIRLIENVAVIAGQNWPTDEFEPGLKTAINAWYATQPETKVRAWVDGKPIYIRNPNDIPDIKELTQGNGGNAVLFYDVSNRAEPRYMGKLDSCEKDGTTYKIENDIDKLQIEKRRDGYYYLYTNAKTNGDWLLKSQTLSPDATWILHGEPTNIPSRPSVHYYDGATRNHCSAYARIIEEGRETAWLEYQTPDKDYRLDFVRIPKTSFGDGTTMNLTTRPNGISVLVYGDVESDDEIAIEEGYGMEHNRPITNLYICDKTEGGDVPNGYEMLPLDLNAGAGGNDIFLCYTRDPNEGDPITDIVVNDDSDTPDGYNNISHDSSDDGPYDLNKGAGGATAYIYMFFTREGSGGTPIYAIDVIDEGETSVADKESQGWHKVGTNLNKRSFGSPDLFLIYNKFGITPIT